MTTTIRIKGELTEDSLRSFRAQMAAASGDDLLVEIDSPGGSASIGLGMYVALRRHPGQTTAHVKYAASAATLPMCGCERVIVNDRSVVVTHAPTVWPKCDIGIGLEELEQAIGHLRVTNSSLAGIYSEKSRRPMTYWLGMLKSEVRWSGAGIVNAGLADVFESADMAIAALAGREENPLHDGSLPPAVRWRLSQRQAEEAERQRARAASRARHN
jgi:ATP-dependent protease ClpP protease subunit